MNSLIGIEAMEKKILYTAPCIEIIAVQVESQLLDNTGIPNQGDNEFGGGAKKHNGTWDLWDSDFDDQANGYHNNPWSKTQHRLWDD